MNKYLIPEHINSIDFTCRPESVPYNYRISYKVAQICLILYSTVKKGGCSFVKIQMIATALTSSFDMLQLSNFISGELPDYSLVRFDPAVNYAIQFAVIEGLLYRQKDGKYKLTSKGKEYCRQIMNDKSLLVSEKKNLQELGDRVLEKNIEKLIDRWK